MLTNPGPQSPTVDIVGWKGKQGGKPGTGTDVCLCGSAHTSGCVVDGYGSTLSIIIIVIHSVTHRPMLSGISSEKKKAKKSPMPLPRKKYSLDYTTKRRLMVNDPTNQTPTAKPRPIPPPKPKSLSAALIFKSSVTPDTSSATTSSHPPPETSKTLATTESISNVNTVQPRYMNLPESDKEEEMVTSELGAVDTVAHPTCYNLPPSTSYDTLSDAMNGETSSTDHIASENKYDHLPLSKSCDILKENEHDKGYNVGTQERYYNLCFSVQDNPISSSNTESPKEEQSPSLDEFLARILQHRRESRDTSQQCEENPESVLYSKTALGRTRSNDSNFVKGVVDISYSHTGTPLTPPSYYNFPHPIVSGEIAVGKEEGWLENEQTTEDREEDAVSLGEKEYRSEWLRRGSGSKEKALLSHDMEKVGQDEENENDYSENTYLKILPSSEGDTHHSLSSPASQPKVECTATDEIMDEDFTSKPESGSPLWGTNRIWNSEVPSPTEPQRENSSLPDVAPRKRHGSHRRSKKLATFDRNIRKRTSTKEAIALQRPSLKRRGNRKVTVTLGRTGPLPLLPTEPASDPEPEVDSDYEWASVVSETGSDYIYTTPHDFQTLGIDSSMQRSASCSELVPGCGQSSMFFDDDVSSCSQSPDHLSISQRPPAPLPSCSEGWFLLIAVSLCSILCELLLLLDPVLVLNHSHVDTPVSPKSLELNKRSSFHESGRCT